MTRQEKDTHTAQALAKIEAKLTDSVQRIEEVCVSHLDAKRMLSTFTEHVVTNPTLLECTPTSVVRAFANAARLGLELDPALKQAALVPRYNKNVKRKLCYLWPMAAGWVQLVKRSGNIIKIDAHAVREGDDFDYAYGTEEFLRFRPLEGGAVDRPITHAFAICWYKGGTNQFRVLSRAELDKLRQCSDASEGVFWTNWPGPMSEAKALKQLSKKLETAVENPQLAAAVGLADQEEASHVGAVQSSPIPELVEDAAQHMLATEQAQADANLERHNHREQANAQINPAIIPPETLAEIKEAAHRFRIRQEKVNEEIQALQKDLGKVTPANTVQALREKWVKEIVEKWTPNQSVEGATSLPSGDLDTAILAAPERPSGSVEATLEYAGRSKPLPAVDPKHPWKAAVKPNAAPPQPEQRYGEDEPPPPSDEDYEGAFE